MSYSDKNFMEISRKINEKRNEIKENEDIISTMIENQNNPDRITRMLLNIDENFINDQINEIRKKLPKMKLDLKGFEIDQQTELIKNLLEIEKNPDEITTQILRIDNNFLIRKIYESREKLIDLISEYEELKEHVEEEDIEEDIEEEDIEEEKEDHIEKFSRNEFLLSEPIDEDHDDKVKLLPVIDPELMSYEDLQILMDAGKEYLTTIYSEGEAFENFYLYDKDKKLKSFKIFNNSLVSADSMEELKEKLSKIFHGEINNGYKFKINLCLSGLCYNAWTPLDNRNNRYELDIDENKRNFNGMTLPKIVKFSIIDFGPNTFINDITEESYEDEDLEDIEEFDDEVDNEDDYEDEVFNFNVVESVKNYGPVTISNASEWEKYINSLNPEKFKNVLENSMQGSGGIVIAVPKIYVYLTRTDFPMGNGIVELPEEILNSKHIECMLDSKNNTCFFKCLARGVQKEGKINKKSNEIMDKYFKRKKIMKIMKEAYYYSVEEENIEKYDDLLIINKKLMSRSKDFLKIENREKSDEDLRKDGKMVVSREMYIFDELKEGEKKSFDELKEEGIVKLFEGFDVKNNEEDMEYFENEYKININVYEYNLGKFSPYRISKGLNKETVDMLCYKNHLMVMKKKMKVIGYECKKCNRCYNTKKKLEKHVRRGNCSMHKVLVKNKYNPKCEILHYKESDLMELLIKYGMENHYKKEDLYLDNILSFDFEAISVASEKNFDRKIKILEKEYENIEYEQEKLIKKNIKNNDRINNKIIKSEEKKSYYKKFEKNICEINETYIECDKEIESEIKKICEKLFEKEIIKLEKNKINNKIKIINEMINGEKFETRKELYSKFSEFEKDKKSILEEIEKNKNRKKSCLKLKNCQKISSYGISYFIKEKNDNECYDTSGLFLEEENEIKKQEKCANAWEEGCRRNKRLEEINEMKKSFMRKRNKAEKEIESRFEKKIKNIYGSIEMNLVDGEEEHEKLVSEFVKNLIKISIKSTRIYMERFSELIDKFPKNKKDKPDMNSSDYIKFIRATALPCIGFNSIKYDLKLVMQHGIFQNLIVNEEWEEIMGTDTVDTKKINIIDNQVYNINTIRMIDQLKFTLCNLDDFIKNWAPGIEMGKMVFPHFINDRMHELIDKKFNKENFPIEFFYNNMKDIKYDKQDYDDIFEYVEEINKKLPDDEKIVTFRDYFKKYNLQDTIPFVVGIKNFRNLFRRAFYEKGGKISDVYQEYTGMPGTSYNFVNAYTQKKYLEDFKKIYEEEKNVENKICKISNASINLVLENYIMKHNKFLKKYIKKDEKIKLDELNQVLYKKCEEIDKKIEKELKNKKDKTSRVIKIYNKLLQIKNLEHGDFKNIEVLIQKVNFDEKTISNTHKNQKGKCAVCCRNIHYSTTDKPHYDDKIMIEKINPSGDLCNKIKIDKKKTGNKKIIKNIVLKCRVCSWNKDKTTEELKHMAFKSAFSEKYQDFLVCVMPFDQREEYEEFRNNVVGGGCVVFVKKAVCGETKITRVEKNNVGIHVTRTGGKTVKAIISKDCNALYPHSYANYNMPLGKCTIYITKKEKELLKIKNEFKKKVEDDGLSEQDARKYIEKKYGKNLAEEKETIKNIKSEKAFGFVKCSLKVKEEYYNTYCEYPPFYVSKEINGSKKLTSYMEIKDKIITTDYFKWCINSGHFHCENITKIYEFKKGKPYAEFMEWCSNMRRDELNKTLADVCKLLSNSYFGKLMMNNSKFDDCEFTTSKVKALSMINKVEFKRGEEYNLTNGETLYKLISKKKVIKHNVPIHAAVSIFCNSKLHMMKFYYDFIDKFISRDDYMTLYQDTDSNILALSGSLDENAEDSIIIPEKIPEYKNIKRNYLVTTKYDERTGGLFKTEYEASKYIGLSSKSYYMTPKQVKVGDNVEYIKVNCRKCKKCETTGDFIYIINGKSKKCNKCNNTGKIEGDSKCGQKGAQIQLNIKNLGIEKAYEKFESSCEKGEVHKVINKGFKKDEYGNLRFYVLEKRGMNNEYDKRHTVDKYYTYPREY